MAAPQEVCVDCDPAASTASTSSLPAPVVSRVAHDPLDPTTFVPPVLSAGEGQELPRVVIEFCDRCRWLHRASWTMTELFLTFPPTSTTSPEGITTSTGLKAITLVPRTFEETGGRFRVWLYQSAAADEGSRAGKERWGDAELVWDRKVEGGFPELKILKQRIRAYIEPKKSLGHSDKDAFAPTAKHTEPSVVSPEDKIKASAPEEKLPFDLDTPMEYREPTLEDYMPSYRC